MAVLTGTTLTLGAVGISIATQEARAAVTLDISPATFAPEDGEVYRPFILVDGDWSYSNVDPAPATWQVFLLIDGPAADGTGWQAVAMEEGATSGFGNSGTYALRGSITAHSGWDRSQFTSDGDPVVVSVPTSVMLVLRSAGGDILADAQAQTTAKVTVEHGGAVLSVSGAGNVDAQLTPDDPTPTLSGGS